MTQRKIVSYNDKLTSCHISNVSEKIDKNRPKTHITIKIQFVRPTLLFNNNMIFPLNPFVISLTQVFRRSNKSVAFSPTLLLKEG